MIRDIIDVSIVYPHQNVTFSLEDLATGPVKRILIAVYSIFFLVLGLAGNAIHFCVLHGPALTGKFLSVLLMYKTAYNVLELTVGLMRYVILGLSGYDVAGVSGATCSAYAIFTTMNHMTLGVVLVIANLSRLLYLSETEYAIRFFKRMALHMTFISWSVFSTVVVILYAASVIMLKHDFSRVDYCVYWDPGERWLIFYIPLMLIAFMHGVFFIHWAFYSVSHYPCLQVIILLHSQVLFFIITNLPYIIMLERGPPAKEEAQNWSSEFFIVTLVFYSNFAFNYVPFYCIGTRFRLALVALFTVPHGETDHIHGTTNIRGKGSEMLKLQPISVATPSSSSSRASSSIVVSEERLKFAHPVELEDGSRHESETASKVSERSLT